MRRKFQKLIIKLIILVPILFVLETYISNRDIVNNLVSISFMKLTSLMIGHGQLESIFETSKDIDYYFKYDKKLIKPYCMCSTVYKEYMIIEKHGQQLSINLVRKMYASDYSNTHETKHELFNLTTNELKSLNIACDLYNVFRRGKNQKIVSYSLYGNESKYVVNLEKIIEQVKTKYKNYFVRIYYDSSINQTLRCYLECKYSDIVDFCNINQYSSNLTQLISADNRFIDLEYMHKMMWRFLPFGDSFVDLFLCRDSDSYVTDREVDSVKEWLASNNIGHIMRG